MNFGTSLNMFGPSSVRSLSSVLGLLFPGIALSLIVALAAMFISEAYGGSVMLYALLIGAVFNPLASHTTYKPGVAFSAKKILRLGVALLGVRIALNDVTALGTQTVILVLSGVLMTLTLGTVIGRLFGLKSDHAILSAGAVAICGASAALAISAALPQHKDSERNTIFVVIGVTALSTIAMVFYPALASILNLSDSEAGVFIGSTIHDVAQVVGAGYSVSDSAGDIATIVKLMRVACLVPVVICIGLLWRKKSNTQAKPAILPLFLVGFVALMALNSLSLLPETLSHNLSLISKWALVTAVASLGIKTSFSELRSVGLNGIMVLVLQTVLLALFALAVISFVLSY